MMPRRRNRPRPASTAITTTAAEATSAVKPKVSFLAAMKDPQLFGPWFGSESWAPWHTVAAALFGESIDPTKLEFFSRHTARRTPPTAVAHEAWLVVGRRGGKSLFAAALGVYMSCFRDHRAKLKPGERAAKSYSCWITRRGCTLAWQPNQASPDGTGGKRRHPRGIENTGIRADKPEAQ
jgi:hypothetical protein